MAGISKSAIIKLILEYIGGKRLQQAQTVYAESQKVARVATGGLSLTALKGMVLNKLSGLVPLPDLNVLLPTSLSSITAPITGAVTSAESLTEELLQNPVANTIATVQGQLSSANSIISSFANTNPLLSNTQIATLTTSLSGLTNAVSTFELHTNTLSGLQDNTPDFITSNNVNNYIANSAVVANLSSNVASLSTNVSSLSTNVSHLSSNVTSLSSNVTSLSANVASKLSVALASGYAHTNNSVVGFQLDSATNGSAWLAVDNGIGYVGGRNPSGSKIWDIGYLTLNNRFSIDGTGTAFEFDQIPYVQTDPLATEAYVDAAISSAGGGDVTNTYLQTLIGLYTNTSVLTTNLNAKADNTYVNGQLALYTNTANLNTALNAKADNTYVNGQLALYTNTANLNTALALKANTSGDTFTGRINAVASSTGGASIRLPHGGAPTSPANGDMWTTTSGLFTYIGSVTWQFANVTYVASNTDVYATFAQNTYVNSTFAPKASPQFSGNAQFANAYFVNAVSIQNSFTVNAQFTTLNHATSPELDFNVAGVTEGAIWVTSTDMTVQSTGQLFYTSGTAGHSFNQKVLLSAASTSKPSLNIPHGTAPTTPANGDIWTTTSGLFVRIAGSTVQLGSSTGDVTNTYLQSTFTNTSVLTTSLNAKANLAGDTFTGRVNTAASAAGFASLRLPHGTTPTTPANGDMWTTSAGLYVQIASATVGPLAPAGGAPVAGSVTFTPTGNVASTNVQAAIAELDSEKADAATFTATYAANSYVNTQVGLRALKSGDTFTGKVNTAASAAGGAGLNLPHGAAPTTPANGDIWTTTGGLYAQIGGTTVGPFGTGAGTGDVSNTYLQATFTNNSVLTTNLNAKADNTYVNSTFSTNTYVNTQLGLKANISGQAFTGAISSSSTVSGTNITTGGDTIGCSATTNAVAFIDTRGVNDLPSGIAGHELTAAFKSSSNVANPPVQSGSGYSYILNIAGWDTASGTGGWPSQLSIGDGIAVRQATNSTTWGTWRKVWHDGNFDPTTKLDSVSFTFSNLGGKPTTLAGYGITDAVAESEKGVANGVATLDANGDLDASQIPAEVLGGGWITSVLTTDQDISAATTDWTQISIDIPSSAFEANGFYEFEIHVLVAHATNQYLNATINSPDNCTTQAVLEGRRTTNTPLFGQGVALVSGVGVAFSAGLQGQGTNTPNALTAKGIVSVGSTAPASNGLRFLINMSTTATYHVKAGSFIKARKLN